MGRNAAVGAEKSVHGEHAREETSAENLFDDSSGFFDLAREKSASQSGEEGAAELVVRARRGGATSSTTALSAFQRAADRYPPLDGDEQIALINRHHELAKKILTMTASNRERDKSRLQTLKTESGRIVEHVCASCWRLAWLIVREQAEERFGRDRASDMLPDLLSEANFALVKAVQDFDDTKTPKFATYAARVIRDHTRAVLSREGYMRLAPSWSRVKRMAVRRMPEMAHDLGRQPTILELQEDLMKRCIAWAEDHLTDEQQNLSATQRKKLSLAKLRKQGMLGAIRDIEEILVVSQTVVSLSSPIGDSGGATLADNVVEEAGDTMLDPAELGELRDLIMKALETLNVREREIVLLRYGFDGSEGWTYSAIADRYKVSSERIRQIERSALEKMAGPEGQFVMLGTFLRT